MGSDEVKAALEREKALAAELAKDLPGGSWEEFVMKVATAVETHGPEVAQLAVKLALIAAGAGL